MPHSQLLSPPPAPLLQAPARRVDNGINDKLMNMTPGRGGRPVKWGKVCTWSLNTHHITLITHWQGTMAATDGTKAAPCPWAAAQGLQVHTVNTIHTHPVLMWTTRHPPTCWRATACQVDDGCFGHNEGLKWQGTHLPMGMMTTTMTIRQRGHLPPQRGQGLGDKPSTQHPPLWALTHRMDQVLMALSTTHARLTCQQGGGFVFLSTCCHHIQGGSCYFLYMLLILSNRSFWSKLYRTV